MFYTVCEPGYHKCEGMAECIPDQDKDCIKDPEVFDTAFAAYSMLH